jgi:hypothetical protein
MNQWEEMTLELELKYPFDQQYPVTSTYQDHLNDTATGRNTFPGTDYAVWYEHPISAICNGKQLYWTDSALGNDAVFLWGYKGEEWRLDFAHNASTTYTGSGAKQVSKGDVLASAGNTGFVIPTPTSSNPYAGTHSHVSLRKTRNLGEFYDPKPLMDAMWSYKIGELTKPPVEKPEDGGDVIINVENLQIQVVQLNIELSRLAGELKERNSQYAKAVRELSAYRLTQGDLTNIKQISMETSKTLSNNLMDGGRYVAMSAPIGAFLALLVVRQLEATGDEVTIITAGCVALTNLALIVGFWFAKKFSS